MYGKELILDLHDCDASTFTRRTIRRFCKELCRRINMVRGPLHWWDDFWVPWFWRETEPHIKGTTAIQFLRTSNITIHTLDLQRAVRLNVFSCRDFDPTTVKECALKFFGGRIVHDLFVDRF